MLGLRPPRRSPRSIDRGGPEVHSEKMTKKQDHSHAQRVVLRIGSVADLLGRGVRLRRPVAALCHELVELGLVLGLPQAIKEGAEFPLLLLEARSVSARYSSKAWLPLDRG
jgi:hypothetical protein